MKNVILIKPRLTEKTFRLREVVYSFIVAKSANKIEIAKEVAKKFKVKVIKVNTINRSGKKKKFTKILGKRSDIKIALVFLKEGQKIKEIDALFENEKPKNKENKENLKSKAKITIRSTKNSKEEK